MAGLEDEARDALLTAIKKKGGWDVSARELQALGTVYSMVISALPGRLPGALPAEPLS